MRGPATAPASKSSQQRHGTAGFGRQALPDVTARQNRTAATPATFVTQWPHPSSVEGGSRRLPQLAQTITGSWSTPNLGLPSLSASSPVVTRGAGGSPMFGTAQMASGITLPYPMLQQPHSSSRAVTASPVMMEASRAAPRQPGRGTGDSQDGGPKKAAHSRSPQKKPTGHSVKSSNKPEKNSSVWHRWGLSVPNGRASREETLERDRERQRVLCESSDCRSLASPMRSHAAAAFFPRRDSGAAGSTGAEFFPPGAFRRVARPQTRQMELLPHAALGIKVVSAYGLTALNSSALMALPTSPAGKATDTPSLVDELPEAPDVLFHEELDRLKSLIDSYAALVYPPEAEDSPTSPAKGTGLARTMTGLGRSMKEEKDPYVLRCTVCRMLLTSGLCSGAGGKYSYHESVAIFDKHMLFLGTFSAMPRSTVVRVFCQMLQTHAESLKGTYQMFTNAQDEDGRAHIRHFFDPCMATAERHYTSRRNMLNSHVAETWPLAIQEVPTAILEECGEGSLWPPLPPRSFPVKDVASGKDVACQDVAIYMRGVREWEEVLAAQSPRRLMALRAHTEAVLQRELLASQLLEPEVLHFAERFQPLFGRLFSAYADAFAPPSMLARESSQSQQEARKRQSVAELNESATESSGKMNHMSLSAFFQFCVDFGIFPNHASVQEIRQIYSTAEAIMHISQPATPASQHVQSNKAPSRKGTKKPANQPSEASLAKAAKLQASSQAKIKKAATEAATIAQASAAAFEASLPKANLAVFDKPIPVMSALELRTLMFFGAIHEWLEECYIRLADLFREVFPASAHAASSDQAEVDQQSYERASSSIRTATSKTRTESELSKGDGDSPDSRETPVSERKAPSALDVARAAAVEAAQAAVPKAKMISAALLLEKLAPMTLSDCPTEDEIEEIFGLVLTKSEADVREGSIPTEISLFELDRLIRAAVQQLNQFRLDVCILFHSELDSDEKQTTSILRAMDDKVAQEQHMGMGMGSFIDDIKELKPAHAMHIAVAELGIRGEAMPDTQSMSKLFMDLGGKAANSALNKAQIYRAMSLVQCARRRERGLLRRTQLSYLAGSKGEPSTVVFGLGAFLECLLKICLHRLGGKGANEIQRGAPAWWKCAWLLSVLGGAFADRTKVLRHEEHIDKLARGEESAAGESAAGVEDEPESPPSKCKLARSATINLGRSSLSPAGHHRDPGSVPSPTQTRSENRSVSLPDIMKVPVLPSRSEQLDIWWSLVYCEELPRYMPTMDHLVLNLPNLFDPLEAESSTAMPAMTPEGRALCRQCGERRSPSGWGSPGCTACGGVDDLCLPIDGHLFGELIFAPNVPEDGVNDEDDEDVTVNNEDDAPQEEADDRKSSKQRSNNRATL